MKKAIQIAYGDLFATKCRIASEAGFRHISVNYTEVVDKTEDEWKQVTLDVSKILAENNLTAVQTHAHYYNPFLSCELTDDSLEFGIRRAIISSAEIGAEYCVIHPRSDVKSSYITSRSLEANKAWFSELFEVAVKHGVGIAAENLPIFPSASMIHPLFSHNADDLASLVDYFGDERFGICWDTGHANLLRGDQSEAIKYLGKRIKCTHIHNNWGMRDDHATPIYGNINWESVMSAFSESGYEGPLTLETHCWYVTDDLLRSFARHNLDCLLYLEELMGK